MTELLLPIGHHIVVPQSLQGQVHGVGDPNEIGRAFGRGAMPDKPLYLVSPDERTVLLVIADGKTEAAELEDLAIAAADKARRKAERGERGYDFEAARDRAGYPSASKFNDLFRESLEEKRKWLKKHQRTAFTSRDRKLFRGGITK